MKPILFLFIFFFRTPLFGQTVDITANPSVSASSGISTNLYVANESIYTETEIGASNFTAVSTAINSIGLNVSTIGTVSSFGNIKIYFKEVSTATTTFATGTYTNIGYTQVFGGASGGTVIINAAGWIEIPLTSSFIRTTGNNLQVLIERTDAIAHPSFVYRTANGNQTGAAVLSGRKYNNTTPLSGSTILAQSNFRAQIRLKHAFANDAAVNQVYTLGKLPIPNAAPHVVSASILNNGLNTLNSIPVTLNITGANTFTDVQTIASLAPGASTTVVFTAYTPMQVGTNNIAVTLANDDDNSNNLKTVSQTINPNTWSYAYGTIPGGSVGFNGNTGDIAAKFSNAAATNLVQVSVNFSTAGQPYKIAVWDATGVGGTPGALLFETASQTSVSGVNVIPFASIVPLAVGNFYVGIKQTGTTNINFSYQIESPIRTTTFYSTQPTGGSTWADFAPGTAFRFMIEPKLQLPIDALVSTIVLPNAGNTLCSSNSETITARLTNVGSANIAANAATVTLKITGANPQTITKTNASTITSGNFETINFTGINFSNAGINYDTVYVILPGDVENTNDSAQTTQTVAARNVSLETIVNNYPLTAICDDMGYTYYNDANGKTVLGVEWGSNIASKAAANASLTLEGSNYAATAGSGATAAGTFTMKRYWNIDVAGVQPTSAVNVRFFYDATEKNATDAAATSFQLANAGSIVKLPTWFKTTTGAFTADAAHVNASGVINAITLTDVNTVAATINNVLYAQFNGIASFSGGSYASGVGAGSVLPVSIAFFKGSKQAANNFIEWKVNCSTEPSINLILERSADAKNFETIYQQNATATRCLQGFDYTDALPLAGANYYRLKTITLNGKINYSTIIQLVNKENALATINLLPNPIKNEGVLTVKNIKAGSINIVVKDIAGKIILSKSTTAILGDNLIDMYFGSMNAGTYFLTVTFTNGEHKTIKFVKY